MLLAVRSFKSSRAGADRRSLISRLLLEEIMGSIFKFFGISTLLLALCVPFAVAKPEDFVGKPAPQFTLKNTMTGDTVSLEALRGKVVVLDFWATWCGPCKEAIPHIAEISRIYKDQDFVAISIDLREDEDNVKKFAQGNQMTWIVVIDRDGGVAKKYDVTAIPTLFVVDKSGTVRYAHVGFFPELKNELNRKVNELLKEKTESITCVASSSAVTEGETILLSGTITPSRSTSVTLKIVRPDGTWYMVNLMTGVDGSYSHRFNPDRAGVWSASVTAGSTASPTVNFEVKGKATPWTPTLVAIIALAGAAIVLVVVLLARRTRPSTATT